MWEVTQRRLFSFRDARKLAANARAAAVRVVEAGGGQARCSSRRAQCSGLKDDIYHRRG